MTRSGGLNHLTAKHHAKGNLFRRQPPHDHHPIIISTVQPYGDDPNLLTDPLGVLRHPVLQVDTPPGIFPPGYARTVSPLCLSNIPHFHQQETGTGSILVPAATFKLVRAL